MTDAPILLDHSEISKCLKNIDFVQEMRNLFAELGNGTAVQPAQTLTAFPNGGDFITYLGALGKAGVFGAKLSPYLPQADRPIITAWTVLMSMETGQPLAMLDAATLTTERTAATTAVAIDHLAPSGRPLTLAIIGSGSVSQAHLRHVTPLRDWAEVRVFSPTLSQHPETQAVWEQLCPSVSIAASAASAVKSADVVMLCTSSGTPVLEIADLSPTAVVTSISTNAAMAHEVDPDFLNLAEVYCDYRETTPQTAGDMQLAREKHGWNPTQIRGDLAELAIRNCPRPSGTKPVFFRSVGLGLEDIAIANAVYSHVRS